MEVNATITKLLNPWIGIFLPLALWLGITPFLNRLDLAVSGYFFHNGLFSQDPFWMAIYRYGIIPAWVTIIGAFIGILFSLAKSKRQWRLPCLYLLLTLAIGSGLIVHLGLKEHWQRPRPRQIVEFGGSAPYRPYYQPDLASSTLPYKSFSSGHSTMGFYFFAIAILGVIYKKRIVFWTGMVLAWGLGGLLSSARVAQGGHFLSDVLASALIMWLTAWSLGYLFFIYSRKNHARTDSKAT